jgi:hypothetical protein
MDVLLAISRSGGPSIALKVFFGVLELLIIGAGIYLFRCRKKLFGYKDQEGDTYASATFIGCADRAQCGWAARSGASETRWATVQVPGRILSLHS